MTQSSRCGSSIARQLPTNSPSTSATRWTDGARSGSHEGMSVERLMPLRLGARCGHAEAAAVRVEGGVDAARQVGQRLAVGQARAADRSLDLDHAGRLASSPTI